MTYPNQNRPLSSKINIFCACRSLFDLWPLKFETSRPSLISIKLSKGSHAHSFWVEGWVPTAIQLWHFSDQFVWLWFDFIFLHLCRALTSAKCYKLSVPRPLRTTSSSSSSHLSNVLVALVPVVSVDMNVSWGMRAARKLTGKHVA